jgi:tetratricopeptide (TPR) repeat protein
MKHRNAILSAAVTLVLSTSLAHAQYRVGSDGRANDASNRIGSGGLNTDTGGRSNAVTGNQIVTGNVTGGKEFRGGVGYTDPGAFRGSTANETSDRFIRGSSGTPYGNSTQNNAERVTAFYGSSRAAPPPPGFQREGTTGAYTPAPTLSRSGSDLRLGSVIDTPQTVLPPPGDLLLPGPVDPQMGDTTISASPLYGIRQWRANVPGEQQFVDRFSEDQRPIAPDQFQLDAATIDRFQKELRDASGTESGNGETGKPTDALPGATDLSKPMGSLTDPNLAVNSLSNSALSSNQINSGVDTNQSLRNKLVAAPVEAKDQSALYARLLQQFQQGGDANLSDEAAQQRFNKNMEALNAAAGEKGKTASAGGKGAADGAGGAKGTGGAGGTDTAEGTGAAEGAGETPKVVTPANPTTQPSPIKVDKLSEGIKAKGLADLLESAEKSMRDGQFGAAIDRYEAAARVAPNNPLIMLGKANAALGASYYGRAEADLRRAFTTGPALLEGQYDLVKFLGEDRLQFLINDLKQIASTETRQSGPTFLLGYIAHNMGNDKKAADYLTETEKRAGGKDELITKMRQVWRVPTDTSPEDANK